MIILTLEVPEPKSQVEIQLTDHLKSLLSESSNSHNYQSLMILTFSLQNYLQDDSLIQILSLFSDRITSSAVSASMKTYLFIVLEFVFSQRNLNRNILTKVTQAMFSAENLLTDKISNEAYVVAFLRAFLQILLNFYNLFPMEAKPFIPAFLGVLFEFFANKEIEEDLDDSEGNDFYFLFYNQHFL